MQLTFLGANRQVTGSRYAVHAAGKTILIDCGLFQERPFQPRNWEPSALDPRKIDAVLLTHAHLDHTGLLPKLVKEGYSGPIYANSATIELAGLVLRDSARLQEEDAAFKRERHARAGRQSPFPYEPLYDAHDVERTLGLMKRVEYGHALHLSDKLSALWFDAGHILGSSIIEVAAKENGPSRKLIFSGDLGQWNTPIIRDPTFIPAADYLVLESTYGNRDHDHSHSLEDQLAVIIKKTAQKGGNLVIPTFALERAQELLFHLSRLVRAKRIPRLMVFLDSPMAVDATAVFQHHMDYLDDQTRELIREDASPFHFEGLVLAKSTQQSKAINHLRGSAIIMAGSGMCTGGRIKHHLAHNLDRPESTILFVGYQSQGTLGRQIVDGAPEVRVHGNLIPVRAEIAQIHGMSAHADRSALLQWAQGFRTPPKRIFLTHGEESAANSLADALRDARGWEVTVPAYKDTVTLE